MKDTITPVFTRQTAFCIYINVQNPVSSFTFNPVTIWLLAHRKGFKTDFQMSSIVDFWCFSEDKTLLKYMLIYLLILLKLDPALKTRLSCNRGCQRIYSSRWEDTPPGFPPLTGQIVISSSRLSVTPLRRCFLCEPLDSVCLHWVSGMGSRLTPQLFAGDSTSVTRHLGQLVSSGNGFLS